MPAKSPTFQETPNEFISIENAAKVLKVSGKTLRRWEKRGFLTPARTKGGHRRYLLSQVQSFKKDKGRHRLTERIAEEKALGTRLVIPSQKAIPTDQDDQIEEVLNSTSTHSGENLFSELAHVEHSHTEIDTSVDQIQLTPNVLKFSDFPTVKNHSRIPAISLGIASFLVISLSVGYIGLKLLGGDASGLLAGFSGALSPLSAVKSTKNDLSSLAQKVTSTDLVGEVLAATSYENLDFKVNVPATFAQNVAVNGGNLNTSATSFNLLPNTATTITIGGAATAVTLGADAGTTTINNSLTVAGITNDIAGTLNLSGNNLTSTDDLTINPTGGGVNIGTGTAGSVDLTDGDLFVTDDLEVDGTSFITTLSINGDAFTDLTGSGLEISSGALTAVLGTSIDSGEITNDSIKEEDLLVSNDAADAQLLTYNASTGGFTWVDAGSATGGWTDAGTTLHPTTTTDSVTLGGTTELAKLGVDGDTDEVQLLVQGNGTQTSNLVVFENSAGTDLFVFNNTGDLSTYGTTLGLNNDADADNIFGLTAAAGSAGSDIFWGDDLLCDVSEANCGWALSSSSSPWTTTSNVVNLNTSTDNVTIGSSTNLAKLAVDGDTDEVQLLIQGNGTQTSSLAVFEDSSGNDLLSLSAAGILTLQNGETIDNSSNNQINLGLGSSGSLLLTSGTTASITNSAGALALNAQATGLNLQADGSIDVNIAGGSGATGCTIANSTGNLTCAGTVTGSNGAFASTLQNAYDNDANGSNSLITLSSDDDSLIFRNPSATAGTDSDFTLQIDNIDTGLATANFKNLYVTQAGSFTTAGGSLTNYGAYFANTSTESAGGNTLTNVGLYATASGGDANYAAIFESGNVGIGDTTPDYILDVTGTVSGSTTGLAQFDGTLNSTSTTQFGIGSDFTASPGSASSVVYGGLSSVIRSSSSNLASAGLNGIYAEGVYTGTGTVAQIRGIATDVAMTTAGTITSAAGLYVDSATNSGGGTITTNHGILVASQTAGSSDFGITITSADTSALWINSGSNSTSETGGIHFGLSRDTNLFRSAASTLRTADNLTVDLDLTVSGGDIIAGASTFNLLNTTATTLNFAGAATTLNIGPTGSGASSIVMSGGSADTGCTLDGSNGNLTCAGTVTGSNGAFASTLQNAYDNDANGSNTLITLSSDDDSLIFRNPTATAGTDSDFTLQIDNIDTGLATSNFKNLYVTEAGTFTTAGGDLTNYGGYFSNTSTESAGGNVLTNVGLYATASGADNNYAAIFESGNVGIGDTTPSHPLEVGASTSTANLIRASGTLTSDSVNSFGIESVPIISPSATATGRSYGGIGSYAYADSANFTATTNLMAYYGGTEWGGVGTMNEMQGIYLDSLVSGGGTVTQNFGIQIANPSVTSGTITNNYGIHIQDQTGGTNDYGLSIAGADTQVLWLSNGADNTDAANGIAFGTSRDTNLYRSAANTLATDDNLSVGLDLTVSGGDIIGAGTGESIDIGEATADTIQFFINSTAELAIGSTNVMPGTAEGNSLGSATNEWQALFIGDDEGIFLGLGADWSIAYDEATDDRLEITAAGATGYAVTTTTGVQTYSSSVVTGTTTTSGFVFDATALTTGTGLYLTSDSITQGKLFHLATTGNTLTTGTLFDLETTATSLTGAANVGSLADFEWEPGSSTIATGDLFRINIGANGTTTGDLFVVQDTDSDLFAVSESAITSSLPHSFTAAGDVAVAYDLNFTNQTASYIKSNAPLYIEAGESFENNDLTLKTYGTGDVIIEGGFALGAQATLEDSTTPSVAGQSHFIAANSTNRVVTNFLGGTPGQIITIESTDADLDFDCTSNTSFNCGNADITTADGDTSTWIYSGSTWNLISYMSAGTAGGNDLAEYFPSSQLLSAGDVVSIDTTQPVKIKKATVGDGKNAIGVISTNPGVVLGNANPNEYAVALAGRVPVKIAPSSGSITIGDLIAASPDAGKAMKSTGPGFIIGRALENWTSGSGKNEVTIFVNPIWADPGDTFLALDSSGNISYSKTEIDNMFTAVEATLGLDAKETELAINLNQTSPVDTRVKDLEDKMAMFELQLAELASQAASLSQQNESTESGSLAFNELDLNILGSATDSAIVSDDVTFLGNTNLSKTFITDTLSVGLLSFDPIDASINTLATPLRLQTNGLNGIDILDGEITIDTEGNIKVEGTVTAQKINIESKKPSEASLGEVLIPAGKVQVTIQTDAVSTQSAIFATPERVAIPVATEATKSGEFNVNLAAPQPVPTTVKWWVVN